MNLDPLLRKPEFPKSNSYDFSWVLENQMGPNVLWLTEWLCGSLSLTPGMKVLDLGCGKALSSIFLAKEFGVHVWATDLWIDSENNRKRIEDAGLSSRITPIKAEAHALPFEENFFDAAISVDAYQYFGTDELYIDYLSRFIKPGGKLGVVVVGLMQEMGLNPPVHLTAPQSNGKSFWEPSCRSFKTKEFWHRLWSGSPYVASVAANVQQDGWRHWMDFERAIEISGKGVFPSDSEALENDAGRYLGFIRLIALRNERMAENFYDPNLGKKAGVDK